MAKSRSKQRKNKKELEVHKRDLEIELGRINESLSRLESLDLDKLIAEELISSFATENQIKELKKDNWDDPNKIRRDYLQLSKKFKKAINKLTDQEPLGVAQELLNAITPLP